MPRPTFYEHMFPRLRQKLGTAFADRIDVLVEFSTLGEYALADDLLPVAMHGETRPDHDCGRAVSPAVGRPRDDCPAHEAQLSRRCSD